MKPSPTYPGSKAARRESAQSGARAGRRHLSTKDSAASGSSTPPTAAQRRHAERFLQRPAAAGGDRRRVRTRPLRSQHPLQARPRRNRTAVGLEARVPREPGQARRAAERPAAGTYPVAERRAGQRQRVCGPGGFGVRPCFNVDFASAARRTAQMKFDLGFQGAAILYSWPAPSNYVECEGNAVWTLPHLMEFLTQYVQQSGPRRSIWWPTAWDAGFGRSAQGTGGLSPRPRSATTRCARRPRHRRRNLQRQIAPRIVNAAERISIYSSSQDWRWSPRKRLTATSAWARAART